MRVAILDDIHDAYERTDGVRRLRERAEVRIFRKPFGDPSSLRKFEVLIANRERTQFTRELMGSLPGLRLIIQTGGHASHIDLAGAAEQGIVVAKASAGYSVGAAELAIGLAIAVMRQVPAHDNAIKRGVWSTPLTPVLHGRTLGVVGLGGVGRHVARLGRAFGMRVLAWSPTLTDERADKEGVELRPLDELMASADVISIHASLTPDSRNLIDSRRIQLMKPSAYLINTARGPIVEELALVRALSEGRIAGAGLDVFDQEPLVPGHPLTKLSNVVLTPHMGWTTDLRYTLFAREAADVAIAYLEGRDLPRFET